MEILRTPSNPHQVRPFHRLKGADQHGGWIVRILRHKIQAVVKTIDKVDICKTCMSEHDLSALRSSPGGMARFILGPNVGLGLYNFPYGDSAAVVSHQVLPQQSPGDFDGWLLVEPA